MTPTTSSAERPTQAMPLVDGQARAAALNAPPDLAFLPVAHEVGRRRLARLVGIRNAFSAMRSSAPGQLVRAVEVTPAVRVAAPALWPVARPVAGEERVNIGPDDIGRQLGLEPAQLPEEGSPGH